MSDSTSNTICIDSPLPASYGVVYRQQTLHAQKSNAIILPVASSAEEVFIMMNILATIKDKGGVSEEALQHPKYAPILQAFKNLGLLDEKSKPINDLQARLHQKPRIEIICKWADNHYAALIFTPNGMAYIDPTGEKCPETLIQVAENQKQPFSKLAAQGLLVSRLYFNLQNQEVMKQEQSRYCQNSYLHMGVQQQDEGDPYSLDWCLTNMDVLSQNIHTTKDALKNATKIGRSDVVNVINGCADPEDPSRKLSLHLIPQSMEQAINAWNKKVDHITASGRAILQHAIDAQKQANQPGATPLSRSATVVLERNATCRPVEKLHVYKVDDARGTTTQVEFDPSGTLKATSLKGQVTYQQRFEALAQDLYAHLMQEDGSIALPIRILSIDPPDQVGVCRQAFNERFGQGNVIFPGEDSVHHMSTKRHETDGLETDVVEASGVGPAFGGP